MEKQIIFNKLLNIIEQNKQGFTSDLEGNLKNFKSGFAVSITNNKNKNIKELLNNTLKIQKPLNSYFGGWFDSETKNYFLDITLIKNNFVDALKIAQEYNQRAVYNFKELKTIYI